MRKLCLMIATLILISPFAANAGPIAFDFIGICENGCSAFGLNDGDAFAEEDVLVFFDGTDTFAGSNYTLTDIQSFVLFGIDFLARATLLDIETTGFTADDVLGAFVMNSSFCYTYTGRTCSGGKFDTITGLGVDPFGSGNFVRSASVPEPGTLALLGIGLFGMGLARRSKRA